MTQKPNQFNLEVKVVDGHYIVTESWQRTDDVITRKHEKIIKEKQDLLTFLYDHSLQTILGLK